MLIGCRTKKLLGKKIKELRMKKGLTQAQLSEAIGIGERNLSKLECGQNFLTAETLEKIAEILNVEIYQLFQNEYLDDEQTLKDEIIAGIEDDKIDIRLFYQIYKSLAI